MVDNRAIKAAILATDTNIERFAVGLDWAANTLYRKLRGQVAWSLEDIEKLRGPLHLTNDKILAFWFS